MTDDTNVVLRVDAKEPVACNFSGMEKPTLIIRCQEDTTSIYIATTGCHLTSSDYNDYGHVTYRIDDKPSNTRSFDESTSNRALGLWSGGQAIPFVKAMFGHKALLTRFTPFNENPVTANFPIAGVEEAIAPLREACGW
jgi:type VI secretion system protein VasI